MAIIDKVLKSESRDGRHVHNVPYDKLDHPCYDGCCENELVIGMGTALKVAWLLDTYLPENNLESYDLNSWNSVLQNQWENHLNDKIKR